MVKVVLYMYILIKYADHCLIFRTKKSVLGERWIYSLMTLVLVIDLNFALSATGVKTIN